MAPFLCYKVKFQIGQTSDKKLQNVNKEAT